MADNNHYPPWGEVLRTLKSGESEKISLCKQQMLDRMERMAKEHYLQRLALSSIAATTWGDVLLALQADNNNVLAHFQQQLLIDFCLKHGLTVYTDISSIREGDSVVTTWNNKKQVNSQTFRVLKRQEKNWLVSLAMWENDETQFKAHERSETITKKNFIVGVRQSVPPIMKKHQTFYFINFDN